METYNFVVSLKNNIIVINNNVDSIQKRYNKYKCSDVFQMMLASSFNDNNYSSFTNYYNLTDTSQGNLSYWAVKIYNIDLSDKYKIIYNEAIKNNIYRNNVLLDKLSHITKKYNILAGDGTVINCTLPSLNGTNISCMTVSSILNISNNMFFDYKMAYDNNESSSMLEHPLTKKDIIILDRGYSNPVFLHRLIKKTNYVVRLKKNLKICKDFIKFLQGMIQCLQQ